MQETLDTSSSAPIKKRKPFLTLILSLFFPGLGQLYNGKPKKAFLFFVLLSFDLLIFHAIGLPTSFYGLMIVLIIHLSLVLYIVVDAVIDAKRQPNYLLKYYNSGLYYLLYAAIVLGTNWYFDYTSRLGIRTFHLPSPSNTPTLLVHDRVVTDMNSYKNKLIDYGDMVVFNTVQQDSDEPSIWVFRVVGLPNDKLEIRDNIVVINGKPSPSQFIKDTLIGEYEVSEFTEKLPNGHQHRLYKNKQIFDSIHTTIKDILVPSDSYYLMGDNRSDAYDSRFIGFIKRKDILGQVIYTYWGEKTDRINVDLRDK